ncbi:MAG: hypothetical protein PHE49_09610 [bacterium]|nr:hypothetical protein [bacterium]
MCKLIQSSAKTREWINNIKFIVSDRPPKLIYEEVEYWAILKSREKDRAVAQLNPTKTQIRLFTKLDMSFDSLLEEAPSSGNRKKEFPTMFLITDESSIDKAVSLIIASYEKDLSQ